MGTRTLTSAKQKSKEPLINAKALAGKYRTNAAAASRRQDVTDYWNIIFGLLLKSTPINTAIISVNQQTTNHPPTIPPE